MSFQMKPTAAVYFGAWYKASCRRQHLSAEGNERRRTVEVRRQTVTGTLLRCMLFVNSDKAQNEFLEEQQAYI
jgi:hypothetical protein